MKRIRKCGNRWYVITLFDKDSKPIPVHRQRADVWHIECYGVYHTLEEAQRHVS